LAGSTYNLGINVSVGSVGVNSTLNAIEQRFQKFSKSVQASSQSMNASMKGSLSTIDQEMNKFDQLNNKMQKVSTGKESVASKSQKMEQTTKKENKALNDLDKTTQNHTKAIKGNNTATENWLSSRTRSIGIALRSTVVWGLATTAIYGSQRALREAHQTMMEVNSEMIALRRVMSGATTDFESLRDTAGNLGVEFAANIQDVISSMVEWGRQGRNQIEVIELTEAALLATNVAEMEAKESVDLLTASLLQFNMDASEATEIIDRWNEVANNFAVNATDIGIALREAGSAAQSAGVSMDSLIGMVTSLSAATAKSGSRIGRSLRTIFSRIMGDMGGTAESLGKVEVALNSVGVALREDESTYRDLSDVLTDLAVRWGDLDEVMQANIARAIGGRRRYSDVIALIENWDMALDATTSSMNSLNSAIEENETYMQGMEANWTQVRAEFNQIINTIQDLGGEELSINLAGAIREVLSSVDDFLNGFRALEEEMQAIRNVASLLVPALMSIKTVSLLTTTTLTGLSTTVGTLALSFGGVLTAINPLIPAIGTLVIGISQYITRQGKLIQAIEEGTKAKSTFNDVTERTNELSKTELSNSRELITQYREMIGSFTDLQQARSEAFSEAGEASFFGTIGNILADITPGFEGATDETRKMSEEMLVQITKLEKAFPDIAKQFEDQINNNEYTQFLDTIASELVKYNEALDNSIAFIDKNTNSMLSNVKQGQRELKMLQEQQDRYQELSSIRDRTAEQDAELFELKQDLTEQWYELGDASKNFGNTLSQIVGKQLDKFGDGGSKVTEVISEMENNINTLEMSMTGLRTAQSDVTNDIEKYREKLSQLNPNNSEHIADIQEITQKLTAAQTRYSNINESIETAQRLITKFRTEIKLLQEGFAGLTEEEILTNLVGAIDILNEFTQELREAKLEVDGMRRSLEEELDFQSWLSDIKGDTGLERLENEIKVYEDYLGNLEDIAQEVFTLDPANLETRQELSTFLEEQFNLTEEQLAEQDIDISGIYDAWDSGEFEKLQTKILDAAEKLIGDFNNVLETKIDTKNLGEKFSEVINTEELFTRFGKLDLSNIVELPEEEINNIVSIYEELRGKDNQLLKIFDTDQLSQFLKIGAAAEEVQKIREESDRLAQKWDELIEQSVVLNELALSEEIKEGLPSMESDYLSEQEQALKDVTTQLKQLDEWEEKTHDLDLKDRIVAVRKEIEKEKEALEAITQIEDTSIISDLNEFDISEITNMEQAEKEIDRLKNGLSDFKDTLQELGVSEGNLEKTLSMLGLDQETIDEVFEEIRNKIDSLENAWYQSMSDAISSAVEQFTSDMSVGDKFGILLREGFSAAFDNLPEEEIQSKLSDIGSSIGDFLNLGDGFGDAFGEFATQVGKVFGQGGSVGRSIATGIGTVISGSPQIGQAIGSIGQMIFGGKEGVEAKNEAQEINDQIKNVQDSLRDFGIFYDAELAQYTDEAGFFQGLFGGEDWDVSGLNAAKMDLEDMEEILGRVKESASQLSSGIMNLFSENLSYRDFRSQFDDTVGQAIQDSILNKLWETQVIEQQMKRLGGLLEGVVNDDMTINQEMLARFREEVDIVGQELEQYYGIYQQILGEDFGVEIGGVEPDVTMDRSFRAGSTSNITYNNTFSVQSQIFLGDKASAREAAKKLAPYIREFIESKA
jgi:TP901 family phage tail tape measure protein